MAIANIVDTLRALQNNDNAIRSAAEKSFSEARTQQPVPTVTALFQVLSEQQVEEPVREQAAVFLRQCLGKLREEGSTWSKLGAGQQECKSKLLQLMEAEAQPKVRRKIADIVQSLGNQLIDIEANQRPNNIQEWPELIPMLMRIIMDSTKDGNLRADGLWIVKELLCSVWPVMVANTSQTVQVLKTCLNDGSEPVRANAASMLCELVDNVDKKEERGPFVPLIEDLCVVLKQLAESGDNKHMNSVLQSLEGTENAVDFFKDCMPSHLMPLLCTVAKSHQEPDTRKLALEVIITFAEQKPKTMSKSPGYIQQVLDVSVHFLMKMEDDLQAWSAEEDEDAEEEDEHTNGKEVVDRLSRCMHKAEKFPLVLETLKPAITTLMQASEWQKVVVGITVLSQIAEYIDDDEMVAQMTSAIKVQLSASNVRVRGAAWSGIAQFAEDHADVVTGDALAQELLPLFLAGLDDQCQRVQSRCMESFQLYGQAVERELVEPFVAPMMEKLGLKLQSSPLPIQRHAITYIAVLAGQVEDGFAPYYGPLMPVLKQVVQNVLHKPEERTLLGKAFECISLLAKAVGPSGFRADAEGIMQAMIQATQVPNLPNDDPVREYMMQASQRICATMKGDFLPFVPHILPGILAKFSQAPKEFNSSNTQDLAEDEEVNLAFTQENGKVKMLVMSTSAMEDLSNAVECVHTFVEELGKLYAPFVSQTAQALLPIFDFPMSEEIRDMAFETWSELCSSAQNGGQAQILTELVHEFLNRILPKMKDEPQIDVEAFKTFAEGVAKCLKKAGPNILSAQQVKHLSDVAMGLMATSFKRREELKKKKATAGDDEDVGDESDEEEELALRVACSELVGSLMQHHADIFMTEAFQPCMCLVQQLIQPSAVEEDRKLAIFFVCDIVNHLASRVTSYWPQFMPQVIQDMHNPSTEIRQPACYALSLAAKDPAFAAVAAEATPKLAELITQSRGRTKKKSERPAQAAADNALSALVEILLHHKQAVAAVEAQMWGVWLQSLPCQEDEEEGQKNHGILLQLVQSEKLEIVGSGGANMPRVISILVDIYKTEMANDDTNKGIGQLVLKIGQAQLEGMASQLTDKQRKKLLRIHREAQPAA